MPPRFGVALKNALRQAPDCILIGEIRDKDTMSAALAYAQSGHLVVATLHANNSYHALNRIINFFPLENRPALLQDLASTLSAIVSQRLVPSIEGGRAAAVEVMLNTRHVSRTDRAGRPQRRSRKRSKKACRPVRRPSSRRCCSCCSDGRDQPGRGAGQRRLRHQPVLADQQRTARQESRTAARAGTGRRRHLYRIHLERLTHEPAPDHSLRHSQLRHGQKSAHLAERAGSAVRVSRFQESRRQRRIDRRLARRYRAGNPGQPQGHHLAQLAGSTQGRRGRRRQRHRADARIAVR